MKSEIYTLLFVLCISQFQIDGNAQIIPSGIRFSPGKDMKTGDSYPPILPMMDTMSVVSGWEVLINSRYNRIDIVPEDTAGIVALFIRELKEYAGITENQGHELRDIILKKLKERCNSKLNQHTIPYPRDGWDFFLYEKSIFQLLWDNFSTKDLASFLFNFNYLNWRQKREYQLNDTITVLNLFVDELEKAIVEGISQVERNNLIAGILNHLKDDKPIGGVYQPGTLDGPAFLFPLISLRKFMEPMTGEQFEELWRSFPSASDMDLFGCLEFVLTKEQLSKYYMSGYEYSIKYKAAFYVVGQTYSDYQEFLRDIRKRVKGK